jgi:two-component system, cell cycle response regulator
MNHVPGRCVGKIVHEQVLLCLPRPRIERKFQALSHARSNSFPNVALISEDRSLSLRLRTALEACYGSSELLALGGRSALTLERVDLIMIDAMGLAPGGVEGRVLDARAALDRLASDAPVIVLGDPRELAWVQEAIEAGATDTVDRDSLTADRLGLVVERAMARAETEVRRIALIRELKAASNQMKTRNAALEQRVARLEAEAWTDPLTGLANRWQLENRLGQMFAEAVRYGGDMSCVMIDLDGFKEVNDSSGHAAGDELLRLVGHVVSDCIRQSDFAARYGGDEFVIIMPKTGSEVALTVARRLQEKFIEQARAWGLDCGCTECGMSIGIASLQESRPLDAEQLLVNADRALYASKKAGKGEVRVFEPRPVDGDAVRKAE